MTDTIDYASEYDNSARVANSGELVDAYAADAARFRETAGLDAQYGVVYGLEPRNRMDIFWPSGKDSQGRNSPIAMFIHGGYWQRLDRSTFSHMARGLIANGVAVAIPSYTLCPDIAIGGIVDEIRSACVMLYQSHGRKLTVVGHSAGGHLAACMMATDWDTMKPELPHDLVAAGIGISGLYDLVPLLQTPVNDALRMDETQAIAASPVGWLPDGGQRFEAWVGGDESGEYHRQSRDLASRWSLLGTPTEFRSVIGANHFTIVSALARPQSPMVKRLVELIQNPAVDPPRPMPSDQEIEDFLSGGKRSQQPSDKTSKRQKKPAAKAKENGALEDAAKAGNEAKRPRSKPGSGKPAKKAKPKKRDTGHDK